MRERRIAAAELAQRPAPGETPGGEQQRDPLQPSAAGQREHNAEHQQSAREAELLRQIQELTANQHQQRPNQDALQEAIALFTAGLAGSMQSMQPTPEPEIDGLISPQAARTTADLYADLLDSLDMGQYVLDPRARPPLVVLIDTAGCSSTYPYNRRNGSVLGMCLDGWLDANIATDAFIQRERDALKASTIVGSETVEMTATKHGLLALSQGGKPTLPKPQLSKIKTYEDWYAATDNLCQHFDATGRHRDLTLLSTHRIAMRELWLRKHTFELDHANFLKFNQNIRSTRVSAPHLNPHWTFTSECAPEQQILAKHLLAVTSARFNAAISSRPPNAAPGEQAANRGKCQSSGCNKKVAPGKGSGKGNRFCDTCRPIGGAKGGTPKGGQPRCADYDAGACSKQNCPNRHVDNYDAIPDEFKRSLATIKPPVCTNYAWFGRCHKSGGDSCQSFRGNTLRHTCSRCFFDKNGKHKISEGSCPN